MEQVRLIEIGSKDVYLEYSNGDVEYLSFTNAKKKIYKLCSDKINYSCVDTQKAVDFLNSLLARYKVDTSLLVLKDPLRVKKS